MQFYNNALLFVLVKYHYFFMKALSFFNKVWSIFNYNYTFLIFPFDFFLCVLFIAIKQRIILILVRIFYVRKVYDYFLSMSKDNMVWMLKYIYFRDDERNDFLLCFF